MSTRITGLMSGMDTESIIEELVSAKSKKVETAQKSQTKLEWKQEIWKELNTKIQNLQTKYISNMRFSDAYSKKKTSVSNSSIASVITGEDAVESVQTLEVNQLAKTAYLTGGKVSLKADSTSSELTALTTMGDLMDFETDADGNEIARKLTLNQYDADGNVSNSVDLEITSSTSISDVLTTLKDAGLNANFDATNKRFFVSSKSSGAAGNFELVAKTGDGEDADYNAEALSALGLGTDEDGNDQFTYVKGQDAKILLNNAEFTSSNNVFEVNGLTITAMSETNGSPVTITTAQDTDGIYDMIKSFLKEYNEVINELDKLYNADSASDYEPLTDEEKEELSDSEIEKYEQKIKDSLLRRDDSVSSISDVLKKTMSAGIEVNGSTLYLSSFGIETLSYFTAADNEKNAYHIDGDEDDSNTSGNTDKLKSMIASDPDTVISFFTQLSKNLYSEMTTLSKSVDGYRSYGSFYDDKKMKSDIEDYDDKIEDLEDALADYEDKWYSKFSTMETTLAKLQNNASAVTSLLGGS